MKHHCGSKQLLMSSAEAIAIKLFFSHTTLILVDLLNLPWLQKCPGGAWVI